MPAHQGTAYFQAITALLLLSSWPAAGQAVTVYSPIVEQGEAAIEYQMDYNRDGDPAVNRGSRHQFEAGYGITDRWKTALSAVYVDQPAGGYTYDRLKWENIYQLFEQGEHWLDAGLYVEYQAPDAKRHAPDVLEFQLLLQKSLPGDGAFPAMRHTLNLVLKRELGALATRGTGFGLAWQSMWSLSDAFRPGFEYYGEPGLINNFNAPQQQSHQLGPVISGEIGRSLEYQLGWLYGLTRTSINGLFKLVVEYKF